MKTSTSILGCTMFLASGFAVAAPTSNLSILSGCWEGVVDGANVQERWDQLSGGLMLGTAKTVVGDSTVDYEFLRIQVQSDKTDYTAFINGVEAANLTLNEKDSTSSNLIFENPQNDFPKKLTYTKTDAVLAIELSGDSEEGPMVISYNLNSTTCHK